MTEDASPRPWVTQADLFTPDGAPVGPAPPPADVAALARRLPDSVRLGTSSWSFPGWAGLVWDRAADPTLLSRHGLAAYARHPLLRTVCVDRSWYGPVPRRTWRAWREQVPDDFRFVVKADRALTTPGDRAFLDPGSARELLEEVTGGLGASLAAVILQFPPLEARRVGGPRGFAETLYRFLRDVSSPAPLAVELRSPELLGEDYAQALVHGGGVHVHVVHPRATPLDEQLRRIAPGTGGLLVVRWMLRPTLSYETARDLYHPFDTLRAPDPERRDLVAGAVRRATETGTPAFVVVNNKAEGSSPRSVVELARALAG